MHTHIFHSHALIMYTSPAWFFIPENAPRVRGPGEPPLGDGRAGRRLPRGREARGRGQVGGPAAPHTPEVPGAADEVRALPAAAGCRRLRAEAGQGT